LPADARGQILSAKLDGHFSTWGRQHTATGRYNYTNDRRIIPVTGQALFSLLQPRVRAQNFSFFLNSALSTPASSRPIFNQIRFSYGRPRLAFSEVRDEEFLVPSGRLPNVPFILNARQLINGTLPSAPGVPNSGDVIS